MKNFLILVRYTATYLCIAIIFLTLVSILYLTNYNTSKEIKTTHLISSLENGIVKMESLVEQFISISSQIEATSDVVVLSMLPADLPPQYYEYIFRVQKNTSAFGAMNQLIELLVLYLHNGFVFTSDGRVYENPYSFYMSVMQYEHLPVQLWLHKVQSDYFFWENALISFEKKEPQEYITYNLKMNNDIFLIMLIRKQKLIDLFFPFEDMSKIHFVIKYSDHTDEKGYEVLRTASYGLVTEKTIVRKSQKLNLSFYVEVAPGLYNENIQIFKNKLNLLVISLILLGLSVSLLFAIKISAPIRRLSDELHFRGIYGYEKNPMEGTVSLLDQLDNEKKNALQKNLETENMLKTIEIEYKLLTGDTEIHFSSQNSTSINEPHVIVILSPGDVRKRDGGSVSILKTVMTEIAEQRQEFFTLANQFIILLFPCRTEYRADISELEGKVAEKTSFPVRIAVSKPFVDSTKIRFAYIEAEFALYKGDFSCSNCVFFDESDFSSKQIVQISDYSALDMHLAGDNKLFIKDFFAAVYAKVYNGFFTITEIKPLLHILRAILINHLCSNTEMLIRVFQIPEVLTHEDIGEVLQKYLEICNEIIDSNIRMKKSHNTKLREDIIVFINNHFSDPNFSLTYLAEQMHISPNYASDFIKEQTGVNYIDYIQQIRNEYASKLLVNTDLSVNVIAVKSGFYSINTFYKSFKRIYKMSPSEYRLLFKHIAT